MIKREPFSAAEARAAAAANPFAVFNINAAPQTTLPENEPMTTQEPKSKRLKAHEALQAHDGAMHFKDLAVAMGCKPDAVSAHLTPDVKSGRIRRTGPGMFEWVGQGGTPPAGSVGFEPGRGSKVAAEPVAAAPSPEPIPAADAEPEAETEETFFCCALYSTGELHLQHGDEQLMLTTEATKQLLKYLDRFAE